MSSTPAVESLWPGPPVGRYSHLVRPGTDSTLAYFSGQIGNLLDGTSIAGIEAQTLQDFRNIETLLAAGGILVELSAAALLTLLIGYGRQCGGHLSKRSMRVECIWFGDGRVQWIESWVGSRWARISCSSPGQSACGRR